MNTLTATLSILVQGGSPPPSGVSLVVTPNPLTLKPGWTEKVDLSLSSGPLPDGTTTEASWVGEHFDCSFFSPGPGMLSISAPTTVPNGSLLSLLITVTMP